MFRILGPANIWNPSAKDTGFSRPRAKPGLVASSTVKISTPQDLTPPKQDGSKVVDFLREKFDQAEKKAGYLNRSTTIPTQKALSVIRMNTDKTTRSLYFVTLSKEYETPEISPGYICNDISKYNAWVLQDAAGFRVVSASVGLGDCHRSGVERISPLGLFVLDSNIYIVSADYGYEWENYRIRQLKDGQMKVVSRLFGGGC